MDKFLRLGAYFAFKMYDNVKRKNDNDAGSVVSISETRQDISEISFSDIESSDFWEKLIPKIKIRQGLLYYYFIVLYYLSQ